MIIHGALRGKKVRKSTDLRVRQIFIGQNWILPCNCPTNFNGLKSTLPRRFLVIFLGRAWARQSLLFAGQTFFPPHGAGRGDACIPDFNPSFSFSLKNNNFCVPFISLEATGENNIEMLYIFTQKYLSFIAPVLSLECSLGGLLLFSQT